MPAPPDHTAPWLLWGTTEELVSLGPDAVGHQIVNVEYHYPVAWTLLLAASVQWEPPAVAMGLVVEFEVRVGVGRSLLQLPDVVAEWTNAELQPDGIGDLKAATELPLPPLVAASTFPNTLRQIPAQSIQINARFFPTAPVPANTTMRAQVTAFAAPVTHVRPEWFAGYFGEEMDGR